MILLFNREIRRDWPPLQLNSTSRRLVQGVLRTSVRHTDVVSGVVQRDATIHQSIAAKVASGFELGYSLEQKRVTATHRTAEPNSASCLDRMDGAANQAQSIGAKRETAHRKPMLWAFLLSSRGDGQKTP